MSYELWISVISIAVVGVSLLIDFDPADPLETTTLESEDVHTDLSLFEEPLENIDDPTLAEFPLTAANSPEPPTISAPEA